MKRIISFFAVGALAATLAGCSTHVQTTYREVKRVPVGFENEQAGEIFYAALSRMPYRDESEDTYRVKIPIVFHYTCTVRSGEGEKFNEAVRRCDTNKDGKITETEARIFTAEYK